MVRVSGGEGYGEGCGERLWRVERRGMVKGRGGGEEGYGEGEGRGRGGVW